MEQFQAYEVAPVVEFEGLDDCKSYQVYETLAEAEAAYDCFEEGNGGFIDARLLWRFYGVRQGLVEFIAERGTEAAALELLRCITGIEGTLTSAKKRYHLGPNSPPC